MTMRFVAGLGVGLAVGVLVGLLVGRELFGLPDMDDMMGDIEEAMGVDSYEERLAIVKEVAADPCGTEMVYRRTPFPMSTWELQRPDSDEGIWLHDLTDPVFGTLLDWKQAQAIKDWLGAQSYESPQVSEWPASEAHRQAGLCDG